MKGRWKEICPPGASCKLTLTTSVTDGTSKTDIRSEEVSNAIAQSLTFGIESEVKIAGSGSTVKFESTTSAEHAVAKTTAQEIGTTSETQSGTEREIDIDYLELDVASVWRWVMAAKSVDGTARTVEIATNIFACSPTVNAPGFLPRSPAHTKSCIAKRSAQKPAPTQRSKFSISTTSQFARGMPANPQAGCEAREELFLFLEGQNFWIYDNNTGQVTGPTPTSAISLPGDVDACVNGYNGKVYFFKGAQYWRYDIQNNAVEAGYPKAISAGWPGLPNTITAAARDGAYKLMFIAGDGIYGWDMSTDTIVPGVGSMRSILPELPSDTSAAIHVQDKTIFYGGGQMFIQR